MTIATANVKIVLARYPLRDLANQVSARRLCQQLLLPFCTTSNAAWFRLGVDIVMYGLAFKELELRAACSDWEGHAPKLGHSRRSRRHEAVCEATALRSGLLRSVMSRTRESLEARHRCVIYASTTRTTTTPSLPVVASLSCGASGMNNAIRA